MSPVGGSGTPLASVSSLDTGSSAGVVIGSLSANVVNWRTAPPVGRLTTIPTGRGISDVDDAATSRWAMRLMISASSIWASAKPRHMCGPRPNGTHA